MSFQNEKTNNPSFILNTVLVPHKSVRIQNQNDKRNTFASYKSCRPSICTTKKFFKNYTLQQRVAPGIESYAKATKSKK